MDRLSVRIIYLWPSSTKSIFSSRGAAFKSSKAELTGKAELEELADKAELTDKAELEELEELLELLKEDILIRLRLVL